MYEIPPRCSALKMDDAPESGISEASSSNIRTVMKRMGAVHASSEALPGNMPDLCRISSLRMNRSDHGARMTAKVGHGLFCFIFSGFSR